jgi:creatinine amidohydrolase
MLGKFLEEMTWLEAEKALKLMSVVLLPIGARTKQHGLHLPLNTDWLQAEYLTRQIVSRYPVVALPTLPYGYYPAFLEYPGSVSIRMSAFRDTVIDICLSLKRQGGQRFYMLNTGISTNWALEPARLALGDAGIMMEYTDLTAIKRTDLRIPIAQPRGTHADEIETSTMLYMAPEVVRIDRAVPELSPTKGMGPFTRKPNARSGVYSATGVGGDPTLATRAKGELLTKTLIESILSELKDLCNEQFKPHPPRQQYLS